MRRSWFEEKLAEGELGKWESLVGERVGLRESLVGGGFAFRALGKGTDWDKMRFILFVGSNAHVRARCR